ncbi:hypothetical protein BN9982_510003 [Mycobacterium tuberculosis]|nr:hypothetical protein BN9982_510003 [Mycobacterium tuberculosis]
MAKRETAPPTPLPPSYGRLAFAAAN